MPRFQTVSAPQMYPFHCALCGSNSSQNAPYINTGADFVNTRLYLCKRCVQDIALSYDGNWATREQLEHAENGLAHAQYWATTNGDLLARARRELVDVKRERDEAVATRDAANANLAAMQAQLQAEREAAEPEARLDLAGAR